FDEEEEVSNTYPPPFGDSEEKSANFLDNAFTRSGQCQSLLQRVFENIKGHGNSVEVGVGDCKYDNRVRSFGRKALFNRKVLYTYFMAETLALTLAAAEAAKCRIHRLHVDIKGEAGQDYPQESVHLDRVLSEFLIQNTSSPNKFTISVITSDLEFSWMEDHDEQYVIKYDGDESLLEVKNITFSAEKHTVFRHIGLVDNITRLYLPKMSLVELRLKDSNIGRSPTSSRTSWKPIMQSLASLPSLKKCLLHDLQTVVVTNRDHLYSISFPRDEEACLLEGENMRDNLQEIGRASAQGTEDLLKDAQEKSIDLLEQKVLHVRFNHISYASGIKIVVPNIQTQGSEV
ncbi:unnamed protein product, partial [Aureobasidium pullulans]